MALLPGLRGRAGAARPAVVPAVRPSLAGRRRRLSRLPAATDRLGPVGVRVPGSGAAGGPATEVLRVAGGRRCPGPGSGGARPAAGRRRHVGAARLPAAGRARVRPGPRPGRCAGAGARPAARCVRAPCPSHRPAGATDSGRALRRDGRRVRPAPAPPGALRGAAGRRRPDDRRDGRLLRGRARRGGRGHDPSPHGVPVVLRPGGAGRGAGTPFPILETVLPSGSVVARGTTPVVDASRGRNDPRKTTPGRRAWSGLEVSPAPLGRGCESPVGGIASGRRRTPLQASVGTKTRSAGREHTLRATVRAVAGASIAAGPPRGSR
jgi:hypothetical protein